MSLEIALFPLSQIVLPDGLMQLRVFEPRYQRLVKETGKRPFASALLNPFVQQKHPQRIYPTITQVQISDFSQLDDGMLGITIQGTQRLQIIERWQEDDGLHVAKAELLPNWPQSKLAADELVLSEQLAEVFSQNPQLKQLYPEFKSDNGCWTAQRWLEILTMQPPLKHQLIAATDSQPAVAMLLQWLQEQTPTN